ncbi:MAG TPA: DUF4832 domain-containing protein [Ferruginibacter sp.]|nr:DUF4832 domain-containing protein [Ferruginibacter sp.]
MKKLIALIVTVFSVLQLTAQTVKIFYKESQEDFANPERGFYFPTGTKASDFQLLDSQRMSRFRYHLQAIDGVASPVNISLVYRGYELDIFKDKPLSDVFLQSLQKDFDIIRSTGLKLVLRFAYTNSTHGGDCKDEYKICPPYGDAPVHIVMQHVQQLKPLLRKNADVIAVLQQGFIGIWGENYFTDHFGYAGLDGTGRILDSSWQHRNTFLKALLDAMPKDRMVQVRTPQIKQRFVYGPGAATNSAAITAKEAFTQSDKARTGLHNDCFLASEDDYGTFYDYGNSVSKRDTANIVLRKYFEAESRYVAVGGETCDDAYSPQNDCEPAGHAESEMKRMHYSYLNALYNTKVNNDWDSGGCMKNIKRKLGYRLLLRSTVLPKKITAGKKFTITLRLENTGYASPFNPRPVQLILRNKKTRQVIALNFNTSVQKWFTGKIYLQQPFILPAATAKGEYELLISMPDGYKSLQSNPAYSIRLANEDVWEETTGYNYLLHNLHVQ